MALRIFLTLAIFFVGTITSGFSYGYSGYPMTRDSGLRQTRRCPTCPADCPESLSSPWYGSPTVYGQPISVNRGYDQRGSTSGFAGRQNFHEDLPNYDYNHRSSSIGRNSYANPHSGELSSCRTGSCPFARCPNSRYVRSESLSQTPEVDDTSIGGFGSIEPVGFPLDLLTSLPSYIPERYRELGNIFGLPQDQTRRISRNYGTNFENSKIGNNFGKSGSRNSIYDDRLTAIETPSHEKVYVVYRADADPSMDDEELFDSIPIDTSGRHRAIESSPRNTALSPMSDAQLEEVVRRAIAEATRENRQEENLYGTSVQGLRGIDYNEHERDGDENPYNPRRPYNDAVYQRFNPDEAIDRQLSARKKYRNGYENPEVSYEPEVSFSPEILSQFDPYTVLEDEKITDFENNEKISGENQFTNIEYNLEPEVTVSEDDLGSKEENLEKTTDDYEKEKNKEDESITSIELPKEISGAEEPKMEENYEKPEVPLSLMNYRTHSRSIEKISANKDEANDKEQQQMKNKEITTQPTTMEKDYVDRMMREANPDLVGEIENPPIVTESTLRLNFEPVEVSTPPPMN